MKRLSLFIASILTLLSLAIVSPVPAMAATREACGRSSGTFLGFPTWYKYLNPEFVEASGTRPAECKLTFNPPGDLAKVGLAVVEILLRVIALVAGGFVIVGGFKYLTSQGEPDRVNAAKQTILNALIGLTITIVSTAIVGLIARGISR